MPPRAALWAAVTASSLRWFLIIAIFVCCGLPLLWVIFQIATNHHVLVELKVDPGFRYRLLARTLLYNMTAALIAVGLAIPAGLALGRGRGWRSALLWIALPIGLLLPSIVFAYGWKQMLRIIGVWYGHSGIATQNAFDFAPATVPDILRCIWTLSTWLWPLPAALMGLSLRRLDTQVQEQALLDGVLWRITLRHLLAPALAAFCICTVLAVQEFAVYEPTGISVVATETRMVFETGAFSSPNNPITQTFGPVGARGERSSEEIVGVTGQAARAAAALATLLPLLVTMGLLSLIAYIASRGLSVTEAVQVGPWPRALNARGWVVALAWVVMAFTVGVPMVAMYVSLKRHLSPMEVYNEFAPQATGSLVIASVSGIVALLLALSGALRRRPLAIVLGGITFLIGGQMLAIALIRLYNHPALDWVYNGLPIIVMAYVGRFGWMALMAAGLSWSRPWRELRDLASVDGATRAQTAWHVIWPLAWPILGASAMLVMILSLTEVPATVLISPQRPQPMVPMLMTWVHMLRYDSMIEGSLLLCGIVIVLAIGALLLTVIGSRAVRAIAIRSGAALPAAKAAGPLIGLVLVLQLAGCGSSKEPENIWLDTGTGPGQVAYPRAATYDSIDDTFFVVDRVARVQHFDHNGKYLNEWRMPNWEHGKPVGISVGPDGNVYVPDTHYQRVMVYSPQGQLLRQWGKMGTGPGDFIYPTDVAFDSKGNVFVSEYGDNDRIQVFKPDGTFLYTFGKMGQGDGEFSRPQSMVIDHDILYVTDACNHRVVVFKTDGTFLRNMGKCGSGMGEFRYPWGLDEDHDGNLIVCEQGNNRIQKINKITGEGLAIWGSAGRDPGQLAYPWAAIVDKRDRIITVDSGNNRLQVFEF